MSRELLSELPLSSPLERVVSLDALEENLPWERARNEGWEGVIAKRRDSLYEQRRSPHCLKMKCEMSQNFVVGGFTYQQGKRVARISLAIICNYSSRPNTLTTRLAQRWKAIIALRVRLRLPTRACRK